MMKLSRPSSWAPLACASLLAVASSGCGMAGSDDLPREAISGKVTLDGQPLAQGVIQFLPASRNEGIAGGATIEAGSYSVPRAQGLVPGQYRVTINSVKDGGASQAAPADSPGPIVAAEVPKELLPPKYNAQSDLVAKVQAGQANQFDFDLKSK
ncbi:hypothetical protein TA3x_005696 [Tundrisphaera sp. TA3]|uniref:hypothetical protein n=1 Tax=Tundrisphaera sp. TA3 TaxID=3435775 RepID=UPI003EB86374